MPLTIVHFTADSLPRVATGSAGTSVLDVLLPFRVDLDDPALSVTGWHLDVEVDGRSWVSRVRTRRLRAGLADALRDRMARTGVFSFDHLPYYAGLHDDAIRAGRAVYLEFRVPGVPPGAVVTYQASVTVCRDGGEPGGARQPDRHPARRRPAVHPRRRAAHRESRRVPGRAGVGAAPPAGGGAGPVPDRRRRPGRNARTRRAGGAGGRTDLRPGGGPLSHGAAGRRRGRLGQLRRPARRATRHCRRSPSATAEASPSPSTWPTAPASAPPV